MDPPAVELVISVEGSAVVGSSAEDDHVTAADGGGRVEVAPGGGRTGNGDVRPRQRQEGEAVDFVGESIFVLFVPAEDVHSVADDAGRVAVSRPGHGTHDDWPRPCLRRRIETKENIASAVSIVPPAPNERLVVPGDARVTVSLVGNRLLPRPVVPRRVDDIPTVPARGGAESRGSREEEVK